MSDDEAEDLDGLREAVATILQSLARGFIARRRFQRLRKAVADATSAAANAAAAPAVGDDGEEDEDEDEEALRSAVASIVQAVYRGHRARTRVRGMRAEAVAALKVAPTRAE